MSDPGTVLPEDYPELLAEWLHLLDSGGPRAEQFYFEKIVPAILPVVQQRSAKLGAYDGLISLLGFTADPVVLTARVLAPRTLVVLHTPESEAHLDTVARYAGLPQSRFHHSSFLHDEAHIDDIYLAFQEQLSRFPKGARLAIEVTAGKKRMGLQLSYAARAVREAMDLAIDLVYVDYDEYLEKYRIPKPHTSWLAVIGDLPRSIQETLRNTVLGRSSERQMIVNPMFHGRNYPLEKDSAFIIMPFGERWSSRLLRLIKSVCIDTGLRVSRADDLFGENIVDDIWIALNKSQFVIADLTSKNANVFYELGIAHTLGKRCILLSQNIHDVPFDIRALRCILYEDNSDGFDKLRNELKVAISNVTRL